MMILGVLNERKKQWLMLLSIAMKLNEIVILCKSCMIFKRVYLIGWCLRIQNWKIMGDCWKMVNWGSRRTMTRKSKSGKICENFTCKSSLVCHHYVLNTTLFPLQICLHIWSSYAHVQVSQSKCEFTDCWWFNCTNPTTLNYFFIIGRATSTVSKNLFPYESTKLKMWQIGGFYIKVLDGVTNGYLSAKVSALLLQCMPAQKTKRENGSKLFKTPCK